jgi:predicted metal-dependent HD superfamily phosphohydrolase
MISRWSRFCDASRDKSEAVFALIEAFYARNAYHNLTHIHECLTVFDEVHDLAKEPRALELAIWFHDVVYVPGRVDNEELSALVARMACRELGMQSLSDSVEQLILATKHERTSVSGDEALIVDIDLSILGGNRNRYNAYAAQIREEYAFVDDDDYRAGRAEVLEGFLKRGYIYFTPALRQRLEAKARVNLKRELNSLSHQTQ